MHSELDQFGARLRERISPSARPIAARDFAGLAVELFALQFKCNPAYRTLCEARMVTPQAVEHWSQIPAVPAAAFKELELTSLAPAERAAVFHSSGTTEQKPSRHFHSAASLAVYEASLWRWFESEALGAGRAASDLAILTPPPSRVPHSSLAHMFETVRKKLGQAESAFTGTISIDGSWAVDFAATMQQLENAGEAGRPVAMLGTAFSFVHLLDHLVENNLHCRLPESSSVMETGGYKNRSRVLPKLELHALITERLGVPSENIVCEYGMSELSSQAYDTPHSAPGTARRFRFPPWARVQIISPETGGDVAEGETGLIRVCDLANVFSVAAIQTEDLGVRRGDGFELVGRAQLAEPRGCSLMNA